MAGSFNKKSINDDSIDIGELAALNEDISDELLDQLQNKLTMESNSSAAAETPVNENDDTTLFEETTQTPQTEGSPAQELVQEASAETPSSDVESVSEEENKENLQVNQSFDDNFIKKYKAKLNKNAQSALQSGKAVNGEVTTKYMQQSQEEETPIEDLSNGNISERPLTNEAKEYNESLDFLDGNVKYSKYVIYIDPKNVDFIEGLTVKERKNLINGILRQQDDIAITKQRFAFIQTVIRQIIIAILTLSMAIPAIYYAINASLEATIDNHRRSQSNWQVLYKEHGKIQSMK